MAQLTGNEKSSSRYFGDIFQLTNWILDSGSTCHMTPQVSNFIPGSLKHTDKYIEVAGGYHITAKQKWPFQVKISDNNGNLSIATFYNVLLKPDICDRLFSIITLINLVHNCLFYKGFCTVYFGDKEKNAVTLTHITKRNHAFFGK